MSDNLPPGCSVDDLPGWSEVCISIDLTCPECGHFEEAADAYVERGDEETLVECPKCYRQWYEPLNGQ
jgi:DNA-directed RNA polymerase subunit M/transcription elongation factor TFIIS